LGLGDPHLATVDHKEGVAVLALSDDVMASGINPVWRKLINNTKIVRMPENLGI
jgi:sulfur transfer complex TusBCD TusB component (DsrH family)